MQQHVSVTTAQGQLQASSKQESLQLGFKNFLKDILIKFTNYFELTIICSIVHVAI